MLVCAILFCVLAFSVDAFDDDMLESIPFEKSKVIYHKQRMCIFRPEKPRCFGSEKIPGDPNEIAHLYSVQKKITNHLGDLEEETSNVK